MATNDDAEQTDNFLLTAGERNTGSEGHADAGPPHGPAPQRKPRSARWNEGPQLACGHTYSVAAGVWRAAREDDRNAAFGPFLGDSNYSC